MPDTMPEMNEHAEQSDHLPFFHAGARLRRAIDEAFPTDELRRVTMRGYCSMGKTAEYLPKLREAISDPAQLKAFDEALAEYETYLFARDLLEGEAREAREKRFNEGLKAGGTVHEE
jgi:hypothetical protein